MLTPPPTYRREPWRTRYLITHNDKQYLLEDDAFVDVLHYDAYQHHQGFANHPEHWRAYDCDCSLSALIQEQADPSFPILPCGDTIRILGAEPLYPSPLHPDNPYRYVPMPKEAP